MGQSGWIIHDGEMWWWWWGDDGGDDDDDDGDGDGDDDDDDTGQKKLHSLGKASSEITYNYLPQLIPLSSKYREERF